MTGDRDLERFVRRGQAAQAAVDKIIPSAPTADGDVRVGSVLTDYGLARIPLGARWSGGWDDRGLPIIYADGRKDIVPWDPQPRLSRYEWYLWAER